MSNTTAVKKEGKEYLLWIMTMVSFIITAFALLFMPDSVPMHYGMDGQIDRYGSKYENFVFPGLILAFNVFWVFFIRYYRKKMGRTPEEKKQQEIKNNIKVLEYTAMGMTVMFTVMQCFFLYLAVSAGDKATAAFLDINVVCNVLLGIFILVLGNVLPKTKRNSIVGFRTVWSMDNDTTWALCNRFAGKAFIVCGLLIIFETLLIGGFASTMIELALIVGVSVAGMVYSAKVYKKYGDHH